MSMQASPENTRRCRTCSIFSCILRGSQSPKIAQLLYQRSHSDQHGFCPVCGPRNAAKRTINALFSAAAQEAGTRSGTAARVSATTLRLRRAGLCYNTPPVEAWPFPGALPEQTPLSFSRRRVGISALRIAGDVTLVVAGC